MAHSQESKIDNTFTGAMNQVNRLEKVFRSDGLLQKSIEEINGDTSWLDDIRQALSDAYDALESGHQGTTSHMQDESVEEDAPDYNPAKASAGGPGYASMPQQVKLAGDSIWDRDGENPPSVTITDYEVVEQDGMVEVTVEHDGPWTIYTDSGFEKEISEMLGMDVEFSEQGMQEDGRAHLEGSLEMESADLSRIKKLAGINEASVDQQYADVLATNNQIKINAFLQGLDAKAATRLTGGDAQTSKISSDGQSFEPSGEPYVHGQPALSPQTIRMTKPVSDRYKN